MGEHTVRKEKAEEESLETSINARTDNTVIQKAGSSLFPSCSAMDGKHHGGKEAI